MKETILSYKEEGLAVAIALEPIAVESRGEPGPIPEKLKDTFLEDLNEFLPNILEILEETKVEIFSPMNEQDYKLGIDTASEWGQSVLPIIKETFSGKILWKGSLFEHVSRNRNIEIDFSGYDIVGFSAFPFSGINRYPSEINDFIETISEWANEDGVNQIFISEFGSYEPVPISPNDEPRAIEIVFEESDSRVDGFFVFDPPRGFGTAIKGSILEDVVKEEFSEFE